MAATDFKFPSNAYQAAGSLAGTYAWSFVDAIKSDDGSAAYGNFVGGADQLLIRRVSLMLSGVIDETQNKAADQVLGAVTARTFGGSSDLWGATITPAIVNRDDFAVVAAYGQSIAGVKSTITRYLVAAQLGFAIPSDAVINGIEAVIEDSAEAAGGGTIMTRTDYIKVKVHYTWNAKVYATGSTNGIVYTEVINPYVPKKTFRHRITRKSGEIVGQWNELANEPTFKQQLNNVMSRMTLNLARNDITRFSSVEELLTDSLETILGDDLDPLYANLESVKGVGPDTDLDVNYDYSLAAFYGKFEVLLTDDGEPLLTDDYEPFMVADGAPEGKDLFTGYISRWDAEWGGSDAASAEILSHSYELANIMLEIPDTKVAEAYLSDGNTVGIEGAGPTDTIALAQTFSFSGAKKISQVRFTTVVWGGATVTELPILSVSIYQGLPGAGGALLGTGSAAAVNGETIVSLNGYASIPAATTCHMVLTTDQSKTGGNNTYPISFPTSSNYADGALYNYVSSWVVATGQDLTFSIWEAGGNTTVPMSSMDPSTMLRNVIDFARSRGAHVSYTTSSIQDTGTTRSYTFKGNTVKEAIDKILELMPGDWWYRYDFAANVMYSGPRPSTPSRYITLGKDIVSLKLTRTIEKIINEIYFSGGQVSPDVNLFIKTIDTVSRADWRRGLSKMSDNRVIVSGTATDLSESQLDRYKNPLYSGNGSLANLDYPHEDIVPSELIGFRNFGNFVDSLELLLMETTYHPDTLDIILEALLPKIAKRVEDIKRDLEAQEQENNPVSPS